mgnify:FL=1
MVDLNENYFVHKLHRLNRLIFDKSQVADDTVKPSAMDNQ